jgi:hypothetical protein
MNAQQYLIFAVLAVGCAVGNLQLLVTAERCGALAHAWLAAGAFGLWVLLAAVCLWEAV